MLNTQIVTIENMEEFLTYCTPTALRENPLASTFYTIGINADMLSDEQKSAIDLVIYKFVRVKKIFDGVNVDYQLDTNGVPARIKTSIVKLAKKILRTKNQQKNQASTADSSEK